MNEQEDVKCILEAKPIDLHRAARPSMVVIVVSTEQLSLVS